MTAVGQPAPGRIRPPARTAALLGLLVLVAFVIRIDALRNAAPPVPKFGDARAYQLLGAQLADGTGYVRPYEMLIDRIEVDTAEYPPGLPVVLAVANKAGFHGATSQRVLLCAIGALTVGLIGLIGRRLGGDGVGYLAAALGAVHPGLWNNDVSLMAEPLAAFMGAALVLMALAVVDRPVRSRWIGLGVVAGLGCLVRSEFLLMAPALMALVAWHEADSGAAQPWGLRLKRLGLGLGALLVVLAPWIARNALVFGEFVPLSNNSGSVMRGANCDAAYHGQYKGLWVTDVSIDGRVPSSELADCFTGFSVFDDQNEAQSAAQLRGDGLEYAAGHAGELPGVMVARVGRTVGLYQFTQQRNFAFAEGRNAVWDGRGTRGFQMFTVLAVVGLVVSSARRTRSWERWLLVVPPAAVLVVVALTYGNPRFRAAAEPAIVVLAALGVTDILALVRRAPD